MVDRILQRLTTKKQQMFNIACTEILEDLDSAFEKVGLFENILFLQTNFAGAWKASSKAHNFYDSAQFRQNTSIFYLADSTDPNTPIWQAQYHEEQMQFGGAKTRQIVSYGLGHMPLQKGSLLCRQQALRAAFDMDLSAKLDACSSHPK